MSMLIPRDKVADYIGAELEPTEWFEIDQARIDAFADCTLDHQFIHVDPRAASQTPLGSTVAHGFLTLSLLSHFAEQLGIAIEGTHMAMNYGLDRVRFVSPVKVNSRVRVVARVLDILEKSPDQYLVTLQMTMEIEGGHKPALIAEWLIMQFV
ncbi:MaoC family dehydratase [Microbulbifer guangxiensis]|uniref:MaoC family dehydratase n=1 Tax=Microbulbifer guangxiensis TaxID=2904249 RepID=UPI001F2798F3|nr:MaoC family dehydratase [Microbulbifer guangxiensis]